MSAKLRPEFARLHAATLRRTTTRSELAALMRACEAVTERHRHSEGAVYAAAMRRWLLITGEQWRAPADGDTTWDQSAHTYRRVTRVDGSYYAKCSCGAATITFTKTDADDWHTTHLASSVPA